ncbi:hypothetical protein PENDEC_c019G05573 [Penicillium decumbens]|uniref:Rhodopsin domain-containing protein n=1 Tax=Penicillium decumbens TaxID=69771 RepID=A0A1V6P7N4_PENDC|nr:hypothetical protein PENDEC_c019G05573 [Penicillium decumbens]
MSGLTDLVILVLPFALTLPLKLPNTKKLRVALMLGSAGLAIGFSIYRLVLVIKEKNNLDSTVIFMKIFLSGNAEGGFGLICSCIPALYILGTNSKRSHTPHPTS